MMSLKYLVVLMAVVLAAAAAAGASPPRSTAVWAVVNTDGSLARGSNAVLAAQLGTDGYYAVTFNRDVSGCAYGVTGGAASAAGVLDDAVVFTVQPGSNPSTLLVLEYDAILGYDSYSSGFDLVVTC